MKYFVLSIALCLSIMVGCRVSDIREVVVSVPRMESASDVEAVRTALAALHGVDLEKTTFDTGARAVRVVYESMVVAHKNIEIAIAEAGYDANQVRAVKRQESP